MLLPIRGKIYFLCIIESEKEIPIFLLEVFLIGRYLLSGPKKPEPFVLLITFFVLVANT